MKHQRRAPRKPLEDVLFFISTAERLLLRVYHDESYTADEYDFALLKKITDTCDRARLMLSRTEICLHLRAGPKPESPLPDAQG